MSIKIGPLEVYSLLPRTNCKKCAESNCMAFAAKLIDRTVTLDLCTPLLEDAKYAGVYEKLKEMLRPPVLEIVSGGDRGSARIGGKLVLYRHELALTNPSVIAVDVTDQMLDEDLERRLKEIEGFVFSRVGEDLKLDMVAIRSTSGDPTTFSGTVAKAMGTVNLPFMLCSLNPDVLEAGLIKARDRRPIICAATRDNWKETGNLALMYGCPLVVSSADLSELRSIAKTLIDMGVEHLILDPGTSFDDLRGTIDRFTQLRKSVFRGDDRVFGYPLLGVPLVAWKKKQQRAEESKWDETCLASMLVTRFADLLVIHNLDVWSLLPLVTLRQNIYTDPRKPVAVDPGLREFGQPDRKSPLLLTTNFSLTYFTVASDIESSRLNCYLMVADSEGLSVETAVAGRKLTALKIADELKQWNISDRVNHRTLVIPGRAARLRGEIEDLTGWTVMVGPVDSSGISAFVKEKWNPAS